MKGRNFCILIFEAKLLSFYDRDIIEPGSLLNKYNRKRRLRA